MKKALFDSLLAPFTQESVTMSALFKHFFFVMAEWRSGSVADCGVVGTTTVEGVDLSHTCGREKSKYS